MKMKFSIDGMHCKSCMEVILDELKGMDCVEKADVSLERGTAEVMMKENCKELIMETIQSLGYVARVQE